MWNKYISDRHSVNIQLPLPCCTDETNRINDVWVPGKPRREPAKSGFVRDRGILFVYYSQIFGISYSLTYDINSIVLRSFFFASSGSALCSSFFRLALRVAPVPSKSSKTEYVDYAPRRK